ncbi:MAG: type II toxin-antitoxin system VapC family toxin [Candidatus Hydrogenedentes bacterium]|nr:type II toxin-antitoxin system VapC family toxin [Candidatus Hydrogenedentota bacterium]
MITAVDTNVLIDVFRDDPSFAEVSSNQLRRCTREGRLVACDIVWAELAALFPSRKMLEQQMERLAINFLPVQHEAACLAGEIWRRYRARGGRRTRIVPNFIIGAHAQLQCDRLLSRDRGFYRKLFKKLTVIDPSR